LAASGLSALAIASLALICVSVSEKRARTEVPSSCTKSAGRLADFSASCTRPTSAGSTFTVALPEDTCTAGASPKKLGAVYRAPITSAISRIAYFHHG
jgi:hypothetical protein